MRSLYATDGAPVGVWDTRGNRIFGGEPEPTPPTLPLPTVNTRTRITTYVGESRVCHPSVVDMGQEWNGYRWWLADTPYPSPTNSSDSENPCIWGSNDYGITWEVPEGLTNPLEPWPGHTYNSDTELVWDDENEQMVVYWRRAEHQQLRYAVSTTGNTWSEPEELFTPNPADGQGGNRVSPAVVKIGDGDWRLWLFAEDYPPVQYRAPSALGPWTYYGQSTFDNPQTAWHGDILRHGDHLIGVFGTRQGGGWPMISTDGLEGQSWKIGPHTPNLAAYRATLSPSMAANHLDLWCGNLNTQPPGDGHRYTRAHESVWLNLLTS